MDLKDKISARRQELGLTLEDVAKVVGVGKSTVRKWETGYIENMRRDKIAKLAEALRTTPAYLMGWEDSPAPSEVIPARTPALSSSLAAKLARLDAPDQEKVEAYADGLLAADKYKKPSVS
jgi:repressor LexA